MKTCWRTLKYHKTQEHAQNKDQCCIYLEAEYKSDLFKDPIKKKLINDKGCASVPLDSKAILSLFLF